MPALVAVAYKAPPAGCDAGSYANLARTRAKWKRLGSARTETVLPGDIFFEEHMKAHKIDEPLGVNRYIERSFKGLPRCMQEAIAANLQAYVKFESAAKPYGKLTRHDGLDALLYAEEYAHR